MTHFKFVATVSAALAFALVGCSAGQDSAGSPATENVDSIASTSSELSALRTMEAIADELEGRATRGALETEWQQAWSDAAALRQTRSVGSVIALLHAHAGAPELIALGSEPVSAYLAAFQPLSRELDRLSTEGAIDPKLAELRLSLTSEAAAVPERDESTERSKTFCCHRHADLLGDDCVQYRTIGIWAQLKCQNGNLLDGACAGSQSFWGLGCH